MSPTATILDHLRAVGHWRIRIHPSRFDPQRIPTLRRCRELLDECVVQLRPWSYPELHREPIHNGQDWIEAGWESLVHREYWRFYQSGQFIHYFTYPEDHHGVPATGLLSNRDPSPTGRYLSIGGTLFKMTEMFEFAARLMSKGVFAPSIRIAVQLTETTGRQLYLEDPMRFLSGPYRCSSESVMIERVHGEADLLGDAASLALRLTLDIFERFNWMPSDQTIASLAEDQRKLLERRLT